jgi:UDP-glucose:(heptosyl)LPS alpha-1,3-glucosyltransferase
LKLAIVRQRYNPYGGAERFVARALPALERSGAEVCLISRSAQGWGAREVISVNPPYFGNLWRDWSFARAARRAWRMQRFDLVQSHERIPGCDVYRAGDGVHRRWLELRRAAAGGLERLGIALSLYHRYVCKAEKQMLEHPRLKAVVCNSRMVREDIQRAFAIAPEKLHVIYNGVDVEHFNPATRAALRAAAREELGYSTRDVVFAFVGSGFARKGLGAAIDALALPEANSFQLVVVGRDRQQRRFEAQALARGVGQRVRFLGGREDVRPLYAGADCLILPTRYDPFPNTVLEALAMGLPAIVSTRCGAAEVIRPGVNGWICEPDDPRALAQLMHAAAGAIHDPAIEGAARATAEGFAIDAMAAKLVELYASL